MVAAHNKEGRSGRSISLAIWYQGALVGQISLGGLIYVALLGAHIGYWIVEGTECNMVVDYSFSFIYKEIVNFLS